MTGGLESIASGLRHTATMPGQPPPALRAPGAPVGLYNEGATCYLNALLQLLFMLPVREAILKWRPDESDDASGDDASGDDASPPAAPSADLKITGELQRLFARLVLGDARAASTRDLVAAFGWSGAEALEQQDVSECLNVLCDRGFHGSARAALDELCGGTTVTVLERKDGTRPPRSGEPAPPGVRDGGERAAKRGGVGTRASRVAERGRDRSSTAGQVPRAPPRPRPADRRGRARRVLRGRRPARIPTRLRCERLRGFPPCFESSTRAIGSSEREPNRRRRDRARESSRARRGSPRPVVGLHTGDDVEVDCAATGERVAHSKREAIASPPGALFLTLKRFAMDWDAMDRVKDERPVDVPARLALGGADYGLCGALLHVGTTHAGHYQGRTRERNSPTSKAPFSAVSHSFRLTFGRAIISRNGLEAWMLFPGRARAEHSR